MRYRNCVCSRCSLNEGGAPAAVGSGLDRRPSRGDTRPDALEHSRSAMISSGEREPVNRTCYLFIIKNKSLLPRSFSHLFLWHMLKTNLVHIRQCRAKPRNPVFTYEETNTSSKLPEKVTSCELQFFVNQKYSTFREQFVYYRVRSAVVLSVNLYIRYARTHKGRRSKLQPEHFKSFSTLVLAERSRFFNLARFRALAPQYV